MEKLYEGDDAALVDGRLRDLSVLQSHRLLG